MFDFDDLFAKQDPYGTFALQLAELPTGDVSATARGLLDQATNDYSTILKDLLDSRPGMDIRQLTLFAAESEAVLVNLFSVHEMVAAHVALAAPSVPSADKFSGWLKDQAAAAVRAVVDEESEHAKQNVEIPYPIPDHLASLQTVLEIPFEKLREAAAAVNALPRHQRVPFVRIFLQALQPGMVAEELSTHVMDVLEDAKAGIASLHRQRINRLPEDNR